MDTEISLCALRGYEENQHIPEGIVTAVSVRKSAVRLPVRFTHWDATFGAQPQWLLKLSAKSLWRGMTLANGQSPAPRRMEQDFLSNIGPDGHGGASL